MNEKSNVLLHYLMAFSRSPYFTHKRLVSQWSKLLGS